MTRRFPFLPGCCSDSHDMQTGSLHTVHLHLHLLLTIYEDTGALWPNGGE